MAEAEVTGHHESFQKKAAAAEDTEGVPFQAVMAEAKSRDTLVTGLDSLALCRKVKHISGVTRIFRRKKKKLKPKKGELKHMKIEG